MKVSIITSFKLDSFTVQCFVQAALKHDANAQVIDINNLAVAQHPQGDHIIYNGEELQKQDVILTLVDINCPSYYALLDALEHYAELVINNGKVHRDTMDELALYRQLQRVNVTFPITVSVFKPDNIEHVARSFETAKGSAFPLLVRLLLNRHRNGLMKIDSMGSLRTVVEALCEEEIPFVIQEHNYHRGAFTGYVFGGETLGAMLTEVGSADDEFRAGLEGMQSVSAKLDEHDESTLARVSNAIGRALIEVCFIKGADGKPCVMEVKPYVRFESLNHSTGEQIAREVADKLFMALDKLMAKPETPDEPTVEPEDTLPPPPPTTVEMVIHPLNDDRMITANVYQDGAETVSNTIWVDNLKCDENWVSFKFNGFNYRIPRPTNAMEVSSDSSMSCGPVGFNCKVAGQSDTNTDFYLKSDLNDGDRSGNVWVLPSVAFPQPPVPQTADAPPPPETSPTVQPEVSG